MFINQNVIKNGYEGWDYQTAQLQVANLTNLATGVSINEIMTALNDDDVNESSRISWKYAASRIITGTPRYLVNDVWVPSVTGYTTPAQWAAFFSGINN